MKKLYFFSLSALCNKFSLNMIKSKKGQRGMGLIRKEAPRATKPASCSPAKMPPPGEPNRLRRASGCRQWRRRSSRRRARRGAVHAAQPQLRFQRRHPDARRNLLGSPGGGIFAGEHDAGFVARGASFLIRRIPRCHFLLFIIFRLNLLHSADKEKKYNFFISKTCLKTAD